MAGRERVLITGASGFVGAGLARELVAAGHDVHLILRPQTDPWRLLDLADSCTVHRADLRDRDGVARAVRAGRPEVVYHLAAYGVHPAQRDRALILTTNLLGTANLLDALAGHDYRALVNAGSSAEYGHNDRAMAEDDRIEPRTDYAVGKAAATLLCQAEASRGRPVSTVRIFTAYGPWESPKRLVPYLMGCCVRGEVPRVSAGHQVRDFIHVADVVELLRRVADSPAAHGRILNAGTGRGHPVRAMIETVLRVCAGGRQPAEFGAVPLHPDEPAHWVASIARTTALTGWRPRFDLQAGVESTWAWFRAREPARAA